MNEISLAEYRQQIESAIEDQRYEEAVAHGRRILDAYPRDLGTYSLLGRAMLEAGQDGPAVDLLRRVISADPERLPAWVGISEAAKRSGELEAAVWYMERAFELATDNETVAEALRNLYGELRASEPERLQLTQGALARLYLRGNLVSRAISELRELLEEHPDRLDLKVALAEALWRDGQRLQASQVCQEILDAQQYSLKANLILGEIWTNSGRAEGELYLEHAQAVDPENHVAQELFGHASPLPPESPLIAPLDYAAPPEEAPPARLPDWETIPLPEPFALAKTGDVMDASIEIPAWLREIAIEGPYQVGPAVEPSAVEVTAPVEGALDEMMGEEGAALEEVPEGEVLKWLRQLDEGERRSLPEARGAEEMPDWLAELELEPPAAEGAPLRHEPQAVEIPEWLLDLAPPEEEMPETAPPKAIEELGEPPEPPAWLDLEDIPTAEEALSWLQRLTEREEIGLPPEVEAEMEAGAALEQAADLEGLELAGELPAGLEGEDLPSAEEALAWLQRLTEREEIGLPPEVEAEMEAGAALEQAADLEGLELAGELPAALEGEALPSTEEALSWLEALAEVEEVERPAEAPRPAGEPALEEARAVLEVEEAWLVEAIEEEAPVEDLEGYIAARRTYAQEHVEDHAAWLDLGRVLWQADRRATAVETYDHLIARGELLDEIIPDLEDYAEQWPNADVQRALGDAYMKADRLGDALDVYRRALASL